MISERAMREINANVLREPANLPKGFRMDRAYAPNDPRGWRIAPKPSLDDLDGRPMSYPKKPRKGDF